MAGSVPSSKSLPQKILVAIVTTEIQCFYSRLILTKRSSQSLDDDESKQEQYILALIGRFLAGVAITQGSYLILTYHSQWDPKIAALYTGVFGFFVAVGMAFSAAVRSIVALLLPTLCTSKGR